MSATSAVHLAVAMPVVAVGVPSEDGSLRPCRSWVATDLVRPWSLNAERSGNWREHRQRTAEARDRWGWLWRASGVPQGLSRITVEATPGYKSRPQDPGNCYPAVKAAIDALEDVGAIRDDTGRYVAAIIMNAPIVGTDGLTVVVYETN